MKYLIVLFVFFASCQNVDIIIAKKGEEDFIIDSYGHFHFGPSPGDQGNNVEK